MSIHICFVVTLLLCSNRWASKRERTACCANWYDCVFLSQFDLLFLVVHNLLCCVAVGLRRPLIAFVFHCSHVTWFCVPFRLCTKLNPFASECFRVQVDAKERLLVSMKTDLDAALAKNEQLTKGNIFTCCSLLVCEKNVVMNNSSCIIQFVAFLLIAVEFC